MKNKAVEFHTQHRRNCAESVALAWSEAQGRDAELLGQLVDCGHGRAPDGVCGALYAACQLAGPVEAEHIKKRFSEVSGGSLGCREIRKSRVLRCVDCVSHAASLLEAHFISSKEEKL